MERRVASVVGIVGDIRSSSLVDGLAEPYVYLPLAQAQDTGMLTEMSIVARRRGNSTLESQIGPSFATSIPLSFSSRLSPSPRRWHWASRRSACSLPWLRQVWGL